MAKAKPKAKAKRAPRKTTAPKPRWRWLKRLLWLLFIVGLILAVLFAGYMWYLDRTITKVFDGRRWSVPARVYAAPLELYGGSSLKQKAFVAELERVGYVRSVSAAASGTYRVEGDRVRVHLRPFQFADRAREAEVIDVRFRTQGITDIARPNDFPVPLIRLDPPVIGSFFPQHGEDRLVLTPDQVPQLLTEGLKSVEDRVFDQHVGFSVRGIARAMWVNLTAGELKQGGSTLTQQLVKSYFLDNRRTLERKVKELAMAVILDARYTKEDLLNAYVNEIFLGQNGTRAIHGFGLGAQFYFNKPLEELTADEIATLIAIIRGPSYYNPFRHPERALARRNLVLDIMRGDGLLTDAEAQTAKDRPLAVVKGERKGGSYYPAFMDLVRQSLAAQYSRADLGSQGLAIFTTLVPRLQDATQSAVTETLTRLEKQRGKSDLEAAAVVADGQTGEVLALVGGRRAGYDGFNRAMHAKRPIGSLMKPVVVLTALQQNRELVELVADTPIEIAQQGSEPWAPKNFDGQSHGDVPVVRALGDSLNLATVRLAEQVGFDAIRATYQRLTGQAASNRFPSFVLGAEPMSPLQVTELYATFASGGFRTPSKAVVAVLQEDGQALHQYPFDLEPVIPGDQAERLTYALEAAMRHGTGKGSRHAGAGVAGKTGTSNDNRDSWFAAYDGRTVSAVWVGRDDNTPMGLTGGSGALAVWDPIMSAVGVEAITHIEAEDLHDIEFDTGMLAHPGCAETAPLRVKDSYALRPKPGCGIKQRDWRSRLKDWFNIED